MISLRFRASLLAIFLFTTTLIVVLQYNANKNIEALVEGNEDLLSEFQMRSHLQELQNNLLSIDNTVRNKVITNNPLRDPSLEAKLTAVRQNLQEIESLSVSDSSQKLWMELNRLAIQKINLSSNVLDTLTAKGKLAAEQLLNIQQQNGLNDEIENISIELDYTRQNYLTQIIKQTDANSLKARRLGLIMGILAVVVVMFTFWYILNRIRKQQEMIIQLNESEKRVREAAEIKEHFISNMSHEIRTPMNAILGYTSLLERQALPHAPKQYVQSIKTSSENLLSIVNDILDLSKLESGMMRIEHSPFSMRALADSVYKLFEAKAEEKGLAFSIGISPTLPDRYIGDSVRISQILVNLINNAIKFTATGNVSVSIKNAEESSEPPTKKVVFEIKDTGIGIEKKQQEVIFERFTQAEESTTRRYGGTGLGLFIVQQIVELLNGKIELASEPGIGTTFTIYLPLELAIEHVEKSTSNLDYLEANRENNEIRILVVEDNPMNQTLLKHLLTEWNMSFEVAGNGKAALSVLKSEHFDLILMDIQMPELDGYNATKIIRQEMNSSIPIIAMTAHAFAGEREKCLSYGMTDYLPKPVRDKDLLQIIKRYTNNPKEKKISTNIGFDNKSAKPFSFINLNYLNELSNGDQDFEIAMLRQFAEQIPAELNFLRNHFNQQDWTLLSGTAHNLKTSVSFMGFLPAIQEDLEAIEKKDHQNILTVERRIDKVESTCNKALEEIDAFLSELQHKRILD